MRDAARAFLDAAEFIVRRKRPKGDIDIDARPLVLEDRLDVSEQVSPTTPGQEAAVLRFSLLRSGTGATLPVHDFLAALLGEALPVPGHCVITRTGIRGRHTDGRWMSPIEEVGETSLRYWFGRHLVG